MQIPEWLSKEAWEGFVEMRKKIKKPLTERAAGMAVRKLDKLRQQGHDPSMVLDQSTFLCWQDLYPLREEPSGDGATRKTFDAIRRDATKNAIRRVGQGYLQMGTGIFGALPPGTKRRGDDGVH